MDWCITTPCLTSLVPLLWSNLSQESGLQDLKDFLALEVHMPMKKPKQTLFMLTNLQILSNHKDHSKLSGANEYLL